MTLATSRAAWLLWVILPYLAVATFVLGHIWRYRSDQFRWTTRSTQLLETRRLSLASPLFHLGLLAVIGGHVVGILIPESFTSRLGISEGLYRGFSATMGSLAGTAVVVGLALLIARRVGVPRVRATTTRTDAAVLGLLALMVVTGMWNTVVHNLIEGGYDYRATVSPWFRGLFLLEPDPSLMSARAVPLSYQLHAVAGWLIFMLWPFSRLVHAWSVPVAYVRRAPILYRSRAPLVGPAGVSGTGRRASNPDAVPDLTAGRVGP